MYFIFFLISSMVFRCLYYYYVWFAFLFPSTVITNRCSIIKIDWSTYYTDTITVLLFVTDRTKWQHVWETTFIAEHCNAHFFSVTVTNYDTAQ